MTKNNQKINFIGIGAAKSGSTWLAECFKEHPEILFSSQKSEKELYFFSTSFGKGMIKQRPSNFKKGLSWYHDQFPKPQKGKVRGEFCNAYLTDENAAQRIKEYNPNIKLLVILRDPAKMMYSLYWWLKGSVDIDAAPTFEEFVKNGKYLYKGKYAKYLKRYFDIFKEEQTKVFLLRDVKNNPEKVVKELYNFLEVDSSFKPSILGKRVNESIAHRSMFLKNLARFLVRFFKWIGLKKLYYAIVLNPNIYQIYKRLNVTKAEYPEMSEKDLKQLRNYYEASNKALEQLIKTDVSNWMPER